MSDSDSAHDALERLEWQACDRVNLIQDGVIALDKPTAETSVQEPTNITVEEYRRARLESMRESGEDAPGAAA
jgi:simple sugar transport system ATP-binding protein